MKNIEWNFLKNKKLLEERNICFEDVIYAIQNNRVLDDIEHKNKKKYPNQRILVVEINNYVFLVPYIEDNKIIFLKTIIPSSKATKQYLLEKQK